MDAALIGRDKTCRHTHPLADRRVVHMAAQAELGLVLLVDRGLPVCNRLDVVFSMAVDTGRGTLDPSRERKPMGGTHEMSVLGLVALAA